MSSFLHWLLRRCEQSDPVTVTFDHVSDWNSGEVDWCIQSGVLVPTHPAEELACRHCAEQPIERVVWLGMGAGTKPRPYLACPNCGPVTIRADQLRQWRLNVLHLWKEVLRAAGIVDQLREVVAGHLWGVGNAHWSGERWQVFVGRGLSRPGASDLLADIRFSTRSVLFVPARPPQLDLGKGQAPRVICIRAIVGWDGQQVTIDREHIEGQLTALSPVSSRPMPRPTRKRAERAANIEVLVRLLKEHVEAARDHAQSTADAGSAQLLPKPSQRDLAKLAEITEMAASRCFRDPAARELRLLWELAGDLERLLALPPPRSPAQRR